MVTWASWQGFVSEHSLVFVYSEVSLVVFSGALSQECVHCTAALVVWKRPVWLLAVTKQTQKMPLLFQGSWLVLWA